MTDIWTAAPWDPKSGQNPASPAQPPCMITAKPVPISAASPTVPHLSPAPTRIVPVFIIKPAVNPATTGMKIPRPAPNSAPMNVLIPTAPHPSPAVMKTAPVNTAKPAASPATTGTQALKPAQSNAQPTTNTPAPAPVTPAALVHPATENTKAAFVLQTISGTETVVRKYQNIKMNA